MVTKVFVVRRAQSQNHRAARKGQTDVLDRDAVWKYEGKTLPEIIMRDPDWFLWVLPRLNGKLAKEAGEIARKAQAIKIPKGKKKKLLIEYRYELDTESILGRRFCGFELVEDSAYYCKKWTTRSAHLDLTLPVREKKYNKRGGRIMIDDFRRHYFGKNKRLTKKRCERFFSNDKNFLCR